MQIQTKILHFQTIIRYFLSLSLLYNSDGHYKYLKIDREINKESRITSKSRVKRIYPPPRTVRCYQHLATSARICKWEMIVQNDNR